MKTRISRCIPLALMGFILACAGGDDITSPNKVAPPALLNQNPLPDTTQPWVRTNKHDYIPGEMVIMFGGKFQPGEQVRLTLAETPKVHDDRVYTITADSVGDYTFDGFRPEDHHVGVSFVLTAVGVSSGYQAQTTFTDAIVPGVHQTNNNGDPAASELTILKPASVVAGTFMIAQITVEGYSESHVICTPSGWSTQMTPSISSGRTNNSSSMAQQVFWKVAGASEPISYTWQFREDNASCGTTNKQVTGKGAVGGIIPYTGVNAGHASGPITHFLGAVGSGTTFNAPDIASVAAGSRVVRYLGNDKEFVISTAGSSSAQRYSVNRPKPGGGFQKPSGAAADANQAASGTTGTVTGSNSSNGGNWVAQTIVLREATVVTPSISINDVTANEGNAGETDFTFTVTLSSASASAVSVNFATANGTTSPATGGSAPCTAGTDYQTRSGTINFPIGSTSQQVVIKVCGDLLNELNETFFVNLSSPTNATIADGQGLGTITNDDAAPTISINDVTQLENASNFIFTVSLSAASSQTVTVNFATANGTTNPATGGASCGGAVDYVTQTGGVVTFNPGETSKPVTVVVCSDAVDEANETFFVNLSGPTNATIGDGQGLGTISDDDGAPTISITNGASGEGTNVTLMIQLSAASGQTITVDFATANGATNPATGGASCAAGIDYVTQSGTATFIPGVTSHAVQVATCNDAVDEPDETFFVDLSNPTNATISDAQGLGTIQDDDAAPSLSIDDVTLAEGTGGTTNFTFTVSLSAASGQTVTVDFATANGTTNPATGGASCASADYVTQNGTRTFVPGDVSETITVGVCADAIDELNETFFVNLSNADNATISDAQGVGTITDDDAAPSISINDVTANEGNSGTTDFTFTVSLSAASSQAVTVNFATANGTTNPASGAAACAAGVDYETGSGPITIPAGQTSTQVVIEVCGDVLNELNETFSVNLSGASNATIADGQGLGTITNDDAAPSLSINDVTQGESSPSFGFTVILSAASSQTVTVNFATANGTTDPAIGGASCVAGVDYVTQSGSLTFNAGETSKPVTVVVCPDAVDEADETFVVNLSSPTNATIGDGQGVGTITDDDAAPTLSINDVTLAEGTSGTTNFMFTVSLSAASGQTVTVDFATANGTTNPATGGAACPGADYVTQTGTRTFVPGDQSETITVVVCADAIDELNETFFVNLSNASNATTTDAQGVGTITDDDLPPDQVGPVTSDVVANPNPVKMNTSFELTAKVDDSNTGNSNIASAEYSLEGGAPGTWVSAGATATPAFNTSPTVTVKWTVPGQTTDVYSVCVRGTDAAGNTGVATCILLAVYDPTAGFVTGGGWINSPPGAYVADPSLTGRANFGFISKYKKGATVPDGSTEFQFQAAGLNFHSTAYQWLVVSGPRAQFKGTGRLNGVDGYGFLLTAIEGTTDQFRIKITNSAGVVVYDNQPLEPETGNAATPLAGGNIVIHRP